MDSTAADPSLTTRIRDAYESRETDGILELAKTVSLQDYSPQELIEASLEASNNNKGRVASIINAWIGACHETKAGGAELAIQLLQSYDNVSQVIEIYPDMVTYSLVYSILCQEEDHEQTAQTVLERAQRMSKKKGRSKRRKEVAAARRRGPGVSCMDVQRDLQELYGHDFSVLQETSDFVVLSKPSGMVCSHKRKTKAGNAKRNKRIKDKTNMDISLVDALLDKNVPLSTLNAEGRGLVHRIDRGTSGCIVLAKTDEMHAVLVAQFFLRKAKKSYTALVVASKEEAIEPCKGEIDIPVDGRPAKSRYRVMERFDNGITKLHVETYTGRKHQVRVHCAKGLNAPILMDPIYSDSEQPADGNGRFLLHASSLSLPDLGINVQAPVPTWWDETISDWQSPP